MKQLQRNAYFIVGKGWKVGPIMNDTRLAVLARVIAILEWGRKTQQ